MYQSSFSEYFISCSFENLKYYGFSKLQHLSHMFNLVFKQYHESTQHLKYHTTLGNQSYYRYLQEYQINYYSHQHADKEGRLLADLGNKNINNRREQSHLIVLFTTISFTT